jgi:hypothetical protein
MQRPVVQINAVDKEDLVTSRRYSPVADGVSNTWSYSARFGTESLFRYSRRPTVSHSAFRVGVLG